MTMSAAVERSFKEIIGGNPTVRTRAPGRLEILGNHTDYNEGTVLSMAVDRATYVAATPSGDTSCRVVDISNTTERRFDVHELANPGKGDWANYVKGLIVELQGRDIAVPGFNAVLGSTVPMSAGMSSSAALEMSMLLALLHLSGTELDWREMAKTGQACENRYVGANTGLLDQFSSLKGRDGHLVYSDFRSLDVKNVPLPAGTALVVANSMVKHNLTNEYNERREACEAAVEVLSKLYEEVTALRDVSPRQLRQAKSRMDDVPYRRALHVVGEIARVEEGVAALENDDLAAFGRFMFESQDSSTHSFENSCKEIDVLVAIARNLPGVIGARLSGGGFGGITVHLVEADAATVYGNELTRRYAEKTGLHADVLVCTAAAGAEIL